MSMLYHALTVCQPIFQVILHAEVTYNAALHVLVSCDHSKNYASLPHIY